MNIKTPIWTSDNKVWTMHTNNNGMHVWHSVESNVTGYIDFPLMYPDGRIAYDFPERLPNYVKDRCKRFLTQESSN